MLARPVAVKTLHPALLEDGAFATRFRREAQLLAALSHPGIVDVHDYAESDGEDRVAYIVMELIDGQPIDEVLAESGPMPAERALGILAQALDALHAAHRRDIVHRDLKPSNLMLRADGQVAVADFGIARALASTKITASHEVLGTALYMAPEQAEGKAAAPAGDLYSIGVVCYELLTGERPFTGESVLEVALKHIREPAPELPDRFPAPVREFVATALAKEPEGRFPDAAAVAPVRKDDGTPEPPVVAAVAPGRTEAPRRSRRAILVPIVIPVVITAGASTVLLIDRSPYGAEAKAPGPGQSVAAPAGASQAGTGPTPAPGATLPPGTGNQPVNPGPGGAVGGAAAGGAGGPGAATPPAGSTTPAAPPAAKPSSGGPAPKPAKPQGCGGTNWGYIVNVGDGLKLGLAKDGLAGGTAVVMGGATAYGWVHTVPSSWHAFNPCNMDSPALVQETDGRVALSSGFSVLHNWSVTAASRPGAYHLKDYMGQQCLTGNGAGRQVTMKACTPGNKAQEWKIP
ncbi:protein kinase [Streptomyces sp. NPDC002054]|uniref:serine/threonine-protein kinase n=1 Tax=Streptomyces sp. NPDC002054 TaxID=3154663 RepID=UPI00332E1FA2